jgi:hypothetical protein
MKLRIFALIIVAFCMLIEVKNYAHKGTINVTSDAPIEINYDGDNCGHDTSHSQSAISNSFINSILPGALFGGGTGFLCAYFDYRYPDLWPLTWFILGIQREALIHSLSTDMQHDHIGHKKTLMVSSSWLTAWITYLLTYDHFKTE